MKCFFHYSKAHQIISQHNNRAFFPSTSSYISDLNRPLQRYVCATTIASFFFPFTMDVCFNRYYKVIVWRRRGGRWIAPLSRVKRPDGGTFLIHSHMGVKTSRIFAGSWKCFNFSTFRKLENSLICNIPRWIFKVHESLGNSRETSSTMPERSKVHRWFQCHIDSTARTLFAKHKKKSISSWALKKCKYY